MYCLIISTKNLATIHYIFSLRGSRSRHDYRSPHNFIPKLWVLVGQNEVLKSNLTKEVLSKSDALVLVYIHSAEQGFELAALKKSMSFFLVLWEGPLSSGFSFWTIYLS